jgi:nucleotide-binding universal stress UspA family protein
MAGQQEQQQQQEWRLMVGLDGSPHAQKAFERALALAVASGSNRPVVLHLLTVIEPVHHHAPSPPTPSSAFVRSAIY